MGDGEVDWYNDEKDWSHGQTVKGHTCEGLILYHKDRSSCVPYFESNGTVAGCDNESDIAITHCPFCGTELGE